MIPLNNKESSVTAQSIKPSMCSNVTQTKAQIYWIQDKLAQAITQATLIANPKPTF